MLDHADGHPAASCRREPPRRWGAFVNYLEQLANMLPELAALSPTNPHALRPPAVQLDEMNRRMRLEARRLGVSQCERLRLSPLAPPLGFPGPG